MYNNISSNLNRESNHFFFFFPSDTFSVLKSGDSAKGPFFLINLTSEPLLLSPPYATFF